LVYIKLDRIDIDGLSIYPDFWLFCIRYCKPDGEMGRPKLTTFSTTKEDDYINHMERLIGVEVNVEHQRHLRRLLTHADYHTL
jgi:hypothetical protein